MNWLLLLYLFLTVLLLCVLGIRSTVKNKQNKKPRDTYLHERIQLRSKITILNKVHRKDFTEKVIMSKYMKEVRKTYEEVWYKGLGNKFSDRGNDQHWGVELG